MSTFSITGSKTRVTMTTPRVTMTTPRVTMTTPRVIAILYDSSRYCHRTLPILTFK